MRADLIQSLDCVTGRRGSRASSENSTVEICRVLGCCFSRTRGRPSALDASLDCPLLAERGSP